MADFLKKHGKLIFILYVIIIALSFLMAVFYMTKTADVHVGYKLNSRTQQIEILSGGKANEAVGSSNASLFNYFKDRTGAVAKDENSPFYQFKGLEVVNESATDNVKKYGIDGKSIIDIVYNFQISNSNFNTLIIIFGVVSLVCYAIMIIFSNNSRRIYYKSNLAVGILMPSTIFIFSLIMMINNFALMGDFNKHYDLYRIVSFNMSDVDQQTKDKARSSYQLILDNTQGFNAIFYVIATIVFVLIMAASAFMFVYTVYRYKASTKERNEIIERAATAND